MITILLLSLLTNPVDIDGDSSNQIRSYWMIEAQENWVIDTMGRQDPMRGLAPMFGLKTQRLIESLGCDHAGCRETAATLLVEMGDDGFRALVWGARHRDRSVSKECVSLLRSFYMCTNCDGFGFHPAGTEGATFVYPCYVCRGTGNLRNSADNLP